MSSHSASQRTRSIALGSVAVAIMVLGLKLTAWWMTGSIALFSDALESIVNIATAMAALFAVIVASRPADAALPWGYGKVEYISAVLEGVLVLLAALLILTEAWQGFSNPRVLEAPWQGLMVNAAAGVLNGVWCVVLIREGRRRRSPALTADGRHLLSDVVSSAGVLVGVSLAALTGTAWLDPALAVLVAVAILWSGWSLLRDSVGGLLDVAVPKAVLDSIRQVIAAHADGAIEAHDVRTRQAGSALFVDFHLVVPGGMSVADAHQICDRIEEALRAEIEGLQVTIHVEPENKAKHSGIVVL